MPQSAPSISRSAWGALALLTLIYACHAIDRAVMSIVAEPVKLEFGLSDGQIGILSGLGYATIYALVGIPVGYIIDRVNRRNFLAFLIMVWSGFTVLCGFAQSYTHLLLARMAVGGAEAGGAPTALSIISDLFPQRRRGTAISIFWMSTAMGTAASFALGGIVAAQYGWRAAFLVAGVPGILLALLLLVFLREPKRGAMEETQKEGAEKAPSLPQTLRFVLKNRSVLHIFVAVAMNSCVLSGMLIWAASYFIRVHELSIGHAGVIVGICVAVFGGLGSLFGGLCGDWTHKRAGLYSVPLVGFYTSLATAALVVLFALTTNLYVAIAAFAAFETLSRMHTAPGYAFLISNLEPQMRGVTISALQVCANLIGYGGGAFFVGTVSDAFGGPESIRYGLLALAPISLWVSVHFFLASRRPDSVAPPAQLNAKKEST